MTDYPFPVTEPPAPSRASWWWAVVLLPVLGAFSRYRGHPSHAFDPETSLAATAAREWVHGRLAYLPHYHFNLHQGSQILDGLLAMLGYALFGDHTMSWGFVGLLWVAFTAWAGALVLVRLVGWRAAWVWAALLTCAPFLIKDGLMALSGGHPPVGGQVLAALAFALLSKERTGRGAWGYALAAGAVVGIGTWYTRSAVVAGPCLLVGLWPAPRGADVVAELKRGLWDRRLWASAVGLALFPALLVATFAIHAAADTRPFQDEDFVSRMINPISNMEGCDEYTIAQGLCEEGESGLARLLAKSTEILGLRHARVLWMQPRSLTQGGLVESWKGLRDAGGVAWALAILLGIPLLGWAIGAKKVAPPALLILFAFAAYFGLYLLTSMRIEEVPETWWVDIIEPPAPTNARYFIPAWLLLLAVLAAGIGGGLGGDGALRLVSGGILSVLLVTGLGLTVRDVAVDGDPAIAFARHRSFRYFRNYVQGRGPPQEAHQVCDVTDPISRGNHLRSWATFNWCDMSCLMHDFTETDDELRWLDEKAGEACGAPLGPEDRAFVAHGLGVWWGSQANQFENDGIGVTVLRAFGGGENLPAEDARWFFFGVQDALWDYGAPMEIDEALELLCRQTKWGTRPLCPLVGIRACEWESPTPPADPMELCDDGRLDLRTLEPDVQREVVRGIGRNAGFSFPPIDPQAVDWSGWSPALKEAWLDGRAAGGRWRWRGEPMEYRPDRIP